MLRCALLVASLARVHGQCVTTMAEMEGSYTVSSFGVDLGTAQVADGTLSVNLGNLGTIDGPASCTAGTDCAEVSYGPVVGTGVGGGAVSGQTFTGAMVWSVDCMTANLPIVVGMVTSVDIARVPREQDEEAPCFPSSATVTLADGTHAPMDALKEGDVILAATADGALTTDTVSLLSIAKPEAQATFVTLTTDADKTLTLTPEHHLPVGKACCSNLKKAKEVVEGDKVWTTSGAALVTKKGAAIEKGLYSPVLINGNFPVVDEVITSFDTMFGVKLAEYGLKYAIPLCKATGSCSLFRAIVGAERAYIAAPSPHSSATVAALAAVAK